MLVAVDLDGKAIDVDRGVANTFAARSHDMPLDAGRESVAE